MSEYIRPEELEEQAGKVIALTRAGVAGGGSTLRVTYFRDIGDDDLDKNWVVDDFLGEGEYSVIYGLPGCGKSVFVTDGAAHVAAGLPWFGRPVTAGVVVYLAAERSKLVRRRLKAWEKHHGVCDLPVVLVEGVFDLCHNRMHADEIARIAAKASLDFELPVVWIIIDTKAQVMAGGDPNSDQEIGAFNANVKVLQETGAHVSVVDHVPHTSPDRMKGSGALAGAADASFLIKNEGFARTVTIGSKSPNDGPDELSWSFTLSGVELGKNAKGKVTSAPIVVPNADFADHLDPNRGPANGRKMRSEWTLILRAMGLMLDEEQGMRVPPLAGVPPGTIGVRQEQLRARAVKIGYTAGRGDDGVVRASFNREIRNMIAGEVLRQDDQLVWRVR